MTIRELWQVLKIEGFALDVSHATSVSSALH